MNNTYKIIFRNATKDDRDLIVQCITEMQEYERKLEACYLPAEKMVDEHTDYILEEQDNNKGRVILAFINNQIAGMIGVWREGELDDYISGPAEITEITDLIVLNEFRGAGLGSKLIAQAENYTREIGLDMMKVSVLTRNYYAKDLYAKEGYRDYTLEMVKKIYK